MKLISALIVSCSIFYNNASAEDSVDTMSDNSRLGYFSSAFQSNANFSDLYGSYSSAGWSSDLMFHRQGFWNHVGFGYSNFGLLTPGGSQNFLLNNLHIQAEIELFAPVHFRGGYGFSFLKTSHQSAMTVGGGWKWGFGLKLPLWKRICANAEITRFDGPGPIGFWTQGLGMEYHF